MQESQAIKLLLSPLRENNRTALLELLADKNLMRNCKHFMESQDGFGGYTRDEVLMHWRNKVLAILTSEKRDEVEKNISIVNGYICYKNVPVAGPYSRASNKFMNDKCNRLIYGILGKIPPEVMGANL